MTLFRNGHGLALPLGVFLTLAGLYLALGSREPARGDARIMMEVAESLVAHGSVEVRTEWPPMTHRGPDGRLYSQYAIGQSLAQLPGAALRQALSPRDRGARYLVHVLTGYLASSLLAALTGVLFFGACRRLGAGLGTASALTLTLAFGTIVFVYARLPFSESLQTLCITGLACELLRLPDEPTRRRALWLGAWAGLAVAAKLVLAVAVAGGGLYLLAALRREPHRLARVASWSMTTFLPLVGTTLVYNLRFGHPFATGYESQMHLFAERFAVGMYALLLSPGKGLLLFAPPMVLGLAGLPALARSHGHRVWGVVAVTAPVVLVYSGNLMWAGDYAWGPRYLTPIVPTLLMPAAAWLSEPTGVRRRRASMLGAVATLGVAVQLVAIAFFPRHHILIAREVKQAWLGAPDRSGAWRAEGALRPYDASFEEMYGHVWLPAFQPIDMHVWLLRHVPYGDPWRVAESDAPWKRYTSLEVDAPRALYDRVRVDWWALLWLRDRPQLRPAGAALLAGFLSVVGLGAWLWIHGARGARGRGSDP